MPEVRDDSQTQGRRLLRLLFLWNGVLPASADKAFGHVNPRLKTITQEVVYDKYEIWTGTVHRLLEPLLKEVDEWTG